MSDPSDGYYGADPTVLERDGYSLATQAVQNDQEGSVGPAIFYYTEAAQALLAAAMAGSKIPNILDKANEYMLRAETLKASSSQAAGAQSALPQKSPLQLDMERAQFLMKQALDEDENANRDEAIELYSEAIELFIKVRDSSADVETRTKVTKLASQALDRAEELKKQRAKPAQKATTPTQPTAGNGRTMPPLGFNAFADSDEEKSPTYSRAPAIRRPVSQGSAGALVSVGPGGYTKEEIAVLRRTSFINGREYVPFMSVDMKEKFAFPTPFNDKDGKLALSPKQKQSFHRWVRPHEYCQDPKMILTVSSFSIRQTIVSDCSFVASLAISAQYEKRFKKKLITSIIFPQNRNGEPVYNPCGKYMVKMNINGVSRKVVIDDHLPQDKYGELLCSFSSNRNELWVSLMEKAYMKVMGGYDFPGSNSNIDLHALTGWIPERVAIRPGKPEFDKDKEFKQLLDRFHKGHCLVTVATGELPDVEADRAGLVPTHAYAMLDVREVKGLRLFMLKNPWSHLRWKGNFSENDTKHWSPELQRALNFDPKSAQMCDNGVFWIDYESICRFFDVFYINWNPEMFKYTTCVHHTWSSKEGPKKDSYNISDNPQYRLEVKATQTAAVWVLLTRHITDKDDFANNKEFITVLVYKTGGKKVYYPYDPPPYKDGVRINSPHYLCKMVEEKGTSTYTLVISQYEKSNTIHYTLRVYATCDFSLKPFEDPYNHKYDKKLTGQWKGRTAGGCSNYPETHGSNPIYQVRLDNSTTNNSLLLELLGPKEYSVGLEVTTVTENVPNAPGCFKKSTSGDYRPGYSMLELSNISGGVYNIMPCTFRPGKEGPFFMEISSTTPYTIAQLQ